MASELDPWIASAKAGNPEAMSYVAHAVALGFTAPRAIDQSLDMLTQAAAMGWTPAQRELQFLARAQRSDWDGLRQQIDLAAWRKAPPKRGISDAPRLRVFEGFAAADECDWLIARARDRLQRGQTYGPGGQPLESPDRSNSEANFDVAQSDIAVTLVRDRIADATGAGVDYFEVAKLLHYEPGQSFRRHADYFKADMAQEIVARGQRVATFLLYLNDDYEGGETQFVEGFKYKGRKGDALLFLNVDRDGKPDPLSRHAGLPTTRGEKWVLSQWIRNRPINAFRTPFAQTAPLPADWVRSA